MHYMRLDNEPFKLIKEGTKTIELRLNDEKRRLLREGNSIRFINRKTKEEIETKIIKLHLYNNFEELYKNFDKISLGYKPNQTKNPKDMEKHYTKQNQEKYGVVGIEIKIN